MFGRLDNLLDNSGIASDCQFILFKNENSTFKDDSYFRK